MAVKLPNKVAIRREFTGEAGADRIQRATQAVVVAHEQTKAVLAACPFLIGKLVSVAFTSAGGNQTITHGLGVAAACIVIRQNYEPFFNGASISEDPTATGYDVLNQLVLNATTICRVDLWFYPRASIKAV